MKKFDPWGDEFSEIDDTQDDADLSETDGLEYAEDDDFYERNTNLENQLLEL